MPCALCLCVTYGSVELLLVWVLKRKEDTNQHCEREHRQDSLPPNVWMN